MGIGEEEILALLLSGHEGEGSAWLVMQVLDVEDGDEMKGVRL